MGAEELHDLQLLLGLKAIPSGPPTGMHCHHQGIGCENPWENFLRAQDIHSIARNLFSLCHFDY